MVLFFVFFSICSRYHLLHRFFVDLDIHLEDILWFRKVHSTAKNPLAGRPGRLQEPPEPSRTHSREPPGAAETLACPESPRQALLELSGPPSRPPFWSEFRIHFWVPLVPTTTAMTHRDDYDGRQRQRRLQLQHPNRHKVCGGHTLVSQKIAEGMGGCQVTAHAVDI